MAVPSLITACRRAVRRAAVPVAACLMATACSSPVPVPAGPDAAEPVCAEVVLALPGQLGSLPRVDTDSQATAAWGSVSRAVVLRCGVEHPGPLPNPCVTVADDAATVDWLETTPAGDSTVRRYISYGRTPTVEVTLPGTDATGTAVSPELLLDLGPAVSLIDAERTCEDPV